MNMKPKDLFGVAVRIFGLYFGRVGLMYVYDYWYSSNYPNAKPSVGIRPEDLKIYLVFAVVYLGLAVYFVAGAPHLLRLSYPEPAAPESDVEPSEKEDV